jgi:DNA-binding SARP family transcriptional activator
MIEFRALGALDLRNPGNGQSFDALLARPKRVALLAYLALARPRGFKHRDSLLGVFWAETSQKRARHALSQALSVLRSGLGDGVIVVRGTEEVGLDLERLWCDAAAFEAALDASQREAALDLYSGELLDGFYLSDCPAFERWLDRHRDRLRARAVEAARSLALDRAKDGTLLEALHWTQLELRWAPYDETALRRLLDLHLGMEDTAGAIREYEAFSRRMREDLGLEPSAETAAELRRVRSGVAGFEAAPSTILEQSPEPVATDLESVRTAVGGESSPSAVDTTVSTAPKSKPKTALWAFSLAALVLLVGAGALVLGQLRGPAESAGPALDARRVLVVPFMNQTGEPSLDRFGPMAADWITQGLTESGLVRAVSTAGIERAESFSRLPLEPAGTAITLARASGAGVVVYGAYYVQDDSIAFQGQISDVSAGEVLRSIGGLSGQVDRPVDLVMRLRERTTGALATVLDPRLESWAHAASQPPSYAAYELYAAGLDVFFETRLPDGAGSMTKAAELFQSAAAEDSAFALPLLWAVYAYRNAGDRPAADSLARVLDRRRHRLTTWERALLDAHLAHHQRDYLGEYRAYEKVVAMTPGSEWNWKLASAAYKLGRLRETVDLLSSVDPERGWLASWPDYWALLWTAKHVLGDHEGELRDARRWRQLMPESSSVYYELVPMAALGHTEGLRQDFDEWWWYVGIIEELQVHGHEEAAGGFIAEYLAKYKDVEYPRARAYWLELANRFGEAEALWESSPDGYGNHWWHQAQVALFAALRGEGEKASRISEWLADVAPERQRGKHLARIAAVLGDKEEAMEHLKEFQEHWGMALFSLHHDRYLARLREYPPFQELTRPR